MKKYAPFILVIGALLVVCSLCALTAYGTFAWVDLSGQQVRVFAFDNSSAEVTESQTFAAKPNLDLTTDAGDINVTAAAVDQIEVDMVKTAWGPNQEEATTRAQSLSVTVTETDQTLKLVFEQPETLDIVADRGGVDSIDFTVRVPVETAVNLKTRFGDIDVTGIDAAVEVETSFGDVDVRDIQADGAVVRLKSSFGDLAAENVLGIDISLETSNGEIAMDRVEATGELRVTNRFGDIRLEDASGGSLKVENQNGKINVTGGMFSSSIDISNSFGGIEVSDVEAVGYTLHTQNGEVVLEGGRGMLTLETSFGGITVRDAQDAHLNLKSRNGSVSFNGSLDSTSSHSVETSFGDIRLGLPPDAALDLNLKTSFGKIKSDLPVTIQGELSETSWQGELNGGGPLLKATTNNGDIVIDSLLPGGEE